MHVALVNAPLLPVPPVLGGPIERTLYETAMGLKHPKMSVISLWADGVADWQTPSDVFYHVNVKKQAEHIQSVFDGRLPDGLKDKKNARHFYYVNGVTDLLTELNPDVIQVHNDVRVMAYLAKQFPQKEKILYMHNEPRYGSDKTADCARVCDQFVFVSQYLQDRFCHHFDGCEERSQVIYNGIDVGAFHPDLKGDTKTQRVRQEWGLEQDRTLIFVGRTVPVKGLHFLLDAMPLILDAFPDVRLLVVGSPLFGAVSENPYLRHLKKRAKALGDAVIFTGFIDPETLPYYYAAADVSVVPSVWGEPFGKVVVEAMASGLPVVGSHRGAIPELIEAQETGRLVKQIKNPKKWAHVLLDLLENTDQQKALGQEARRKAVEQFSTDVRIKRLQSFYDRLSMRVT